MGEGSRNRSLRTDNAELRRVYATHHPPRPDLRAPPHLRSLPRPWEAHNNISPFPRGAHRGRGEMGRVIGCECIRASPQDKCSGRGQPQTARVCFWEEAVAEVLLGKRHVSPEVRHRYNVEWGVGNENTGGRRGGGGPHQRPKRGPAPWPLSVEMCAPVYTGIPISSKGSQQSRIGLKIFLLLYVGD